MRKISYRLVYNRKKRLNGEGKALVQVEAYLERRKIYFSTHIYLRPEEWDNRQKRIRHHPQQEALNQMLSEYISELERLELSLWKKGHPITLSLIKAQRSTTTGESFLTFVRKEVEGASLKPSTKRNQLTTVALLEEFRSTIDFKDLDYNFIADFERHLYESGYHTNTVAKHMKHLKTFVNAAINKGHIDLNDYAFRRYRIKVKEGKHTFLLPEELERLERLSPTLAEPTLRHTLDAFLFCCYTGLRYSDFVNIREENIVWVEGKQWLVFNSVKTDAEVKLPLYLLFDGKALALLQPYQKALPAFFALKANSTVNKELIRIGQLAHIAKHFSFHTARHTNATLLIYKGANITTVQKLLGHKNIATTQIYGEVMDSTIVRDLESCNTKKASSESGISSMKRGKTDNG